MTQLPGVDILCLCSHHGVGGAQNCAGRLVRDFRQRGYDAALGFLFERDPDCRHGGDDYFVISPSPPRNFLEWVRFLGACRAQFARRRPRVTIGFHPLANIIGAIMGGFSGNFVSTQGWPARAQGRRTALIQSLLTRTPLVGANIAVSRYVASTFSSGAFALGQEKRKGVGNSAYERKTTIVYNDPPPLPSIGDDRSAARARFHMPRGVRILGALGRLHAHKNFQLALRALSGTQDHLLYIAGAGPQAAFLYRLAAELHLAEKVFFLGELGGDDVVRFLHAIDLLLMPSLYEGHPLVMLEAMAAGTPVLAHDIAVMREAGGAAAIYAVADPAHWATLITGLTGDDLADLARRGRRRAAYFASRSMVDGYLSAAGLPRVKGAARDPTGI